MWVFGYGSLIWKVDFPYERRVPGYVKGFVRRFWQGSTDHRGTPQAPGRVVTLVPYHEWATRYVHDDPHHMKEVESCWGIAYKIPESEVESVRDHLDHREKDGYQTLHADVYHPDGEKDENGLDIPIIKDALIYVATGDNESFLGPVDLKAMAKQIAEAKGPSGWNIDYLLGLCHSIQILAPSSPDPHLVTLEREVKEAFQKFKTSHGSESAILPTGSIDEHKFEELRSLLKVDLDALLFGEKTATEALNLARKSSDGTALVSASADLTTSGKWQADVTACCRVDDEGNTTETVDARITCSEKNGQCHCIANESTVINQAR
ncbi:ChaC-like protein-domain-containing protein [Phlyctochytrium arcticum]|nr:ChaC-like protein-domain-containing protein [Phlyctochytrium arcticum]